MRKRLIVASKWLWGAAVVVAAGAIIWRSRAEIAVMLERIPLWLLASSFLLVVLAKLFLGENARIAASKSGIELDFPVATRLYNLSQLGKYLPGSIWQYVGRAAAYRNRGASYAQIRDSLMTESLWVIVGAMATGFVLCGPAIVAIIKRSLSPMLQLWLIAGMAIAAAGFCALMLWKREGLLRYLRSAVPTPRALLVQVFVWMLLGLSFWVLLRACGMTAGPFFSIGLFAAAYAVGFMVPFAPAGLGIRDGILTLGLLPYAPAGQALAVTVIARLIYLLVELLLVAVQEAWVALPGKSGGKAA